MPSHTRLWRTVRVFISSTFRDMHAERDHLVRVVFPALRERLQPHRVHLVDVDLRWGVTREQAENDESLALCLRQVDACRPFFLGLLGERYGWVPGTAGAARDFPWLEGDTGRSVTELEALHALEHGSPGCVRALFAFRDPAALDTVPGPLREDFVESDPEARRRLEEFKRRLRASPFPRLDPYPCRWDPDAIDPVTRRRGRLGGLEEFGDRVLDWLWHGLREELGLDAVSPAEVDPLQEEAEHHERFVEVRQRVFVGRESLLAELEAYADGSDDGLCVVAGPSGAGKSAALARFVTWYRQRRPVVRVLPHFVGASPASTSLRGLLRRWCLELRGGGEDVPEEAAALAELFRELLWRQPSDAPTVIVLDGVNQLDAADQAHELHWLPEALPPGVRLVVSCLEGPSPLPEKLRRRASRCLRVTPLTDAERLDIVREVPSLSAKALDGGQVRLLLSNPATANPLFLLVALEELRGFGSFEQLNQRIAALPRGDDAVSLLFDQVLERLEQDFDAGLVRAILGLLAASRRGLSEAELRRLTKSDELFPVLRQMRPYLLSRGGLLGFYHSDLARAVRRRYLAGEEERRAAHLRLADHFAAADSDPGRRLDETPWQLAEAGAWERLYRLLGDLPFFDAAWRADPFEVKELWARLEAASAWRRVEAYRPVIEAPEGHPPDTVGRVATLLADTGHPREAFALRQHLVRHYRTAGDPARLAAALGNEALLRKARGDLDGALKLLAEAEQLWRDLGDSHGLQATLGNRARVLKMLGDLDGALALLAEQERLCRELGNRQGLQVALGNRALILQARNDLDGALALLLERERICRELGNRHGLQIALGNQALVHQARGEFGRALELLREQERICRELGNRHGLQIALGSMASVLQRQGRAAEAMTLLCQQEALCREMGNRLGLQIALTTQALVRESAGERDRALELFQEAERICRELRHPEGLALALHHQARLLGGSEGLAKAEEAAGIAAAHGLKALAELIAPNLQRLCSEGVLRRTDL